MGSLGNVFEVGTGELVQGEQVIHHSLVQVFTFILPSGLFLLHNCTTEFIATFHVFCMQLSVLCVYLLHVIITEGLVLHMYTRNYMNGLVFRGFLDFMLEY